MFNAEQRAYMEELNRVPPAMRCWCGWFGKGGCHVCPRDKTCADKLAARCETCGADPGPTNQFPTTHRNGCPRQGLPHRETPNS